MLHRMPFCILSCASLLSAPALAVEVVSNSLTDEQQIDQQIQQLTEKRKRCKLQAELADQNAQRLMTQDWMAYRREIAKQGRLEDRIKQLDAQIEQLQQQKQQIHPQSSSSDSAQKSS